jgi:hypothetical protein
MLPEDLVLDKVSSFLTFRELLLYANNRLFFRSLAYQARLRRREVLTELMSCPVLYSKLRGVFPPSLEERLIQTAIRTMNLELTRIIASIRGPEAFRIPPTPGLSMIDLITYDPRVFGWMIPFLYCRGTRISVVRPGQGLDSFLILLRLLRNERYNLTIYGTDYRLYQVVLGDTIGLISHQIDEEAGRLGGIELLTDSRLRAYLRLLLEGHIFTLGRGWTRHVRAILANSAIRERLRRLLDLV